MSVVPASAILSCRESKTVSRRVMALLSLTRGPAIAVTSPRMAPKATTTMPMLSQSLISACLPA